MQCSNELRALGATLVTVLVVGSSLGCGGPEWTNGTEPSEEVEVVQQPLTYPGGWQDVEQFATTKEITRSWVNRHQAPVGYRNGGCSGTLIGDGLYFTVAHCIFAGEIGNFVRFGYQLDPSNQLRPFNRYDVAQIVEDNPNEAVVGITDHGLLRLHGNPENEYGFTTIDAAAPDINEPLVIIGHPGIPTEPEGHTSYKTALVPNIECISTKASTGLTYEITYADGTTYGGASGAGVLNPATGRLAGLHRSGGFNQNLCSRGTGRANTIMRDQAASDFMKTDRGSGRLYSFSTNALDQHRWTQSWRSSWHHIVPGSYRGRTTKELLFYDSQNGEARFYIVTSVGITALGPTHTGLNHPTQPWGQIIPTGGIPGGSDNNRILFLNTLTNNYQLFITDGTGSLTRLLGANEFLTETDGAPSSYRLGVSRKTSTAPQVALYDPLRGRLGLFSVSTTTGKLSLIKATSGFSKTISAMVVGEYRSASPEKEVLLYDPIQDNMTLVWFDATGAANRIGPTPFGSSMFTQVAGGHFLQGRAELLAYRPSATDTYANVHENTGAHYYYNVSVDGADTLSFLEIEVERGERRTYDKFIVGDFLSPVRSDVILFSRYRP